MKATLVTQHNTSAVYPALEDSKGQKLTAPFTTFDEKMAMEYAELAAKLNPHDDRNTVKWPERRMVF